MFDLEEKTEKEIDGLCNAFIDARSVIEKKYKSLMEDMADEAWQKFLDFLDNESNYSISTWIKRRIDNILEGLLSGDTKYLKDSQIISQYDWERLKKIRIAIWESAGGEIADSTIAALLKENDELKKQLANERSYRNY